MILTKLDGDTRGGAALSRARGDGQAHQVLRRGREAQTTSSPSTPTAWPRRILGMGDVLTLIDKASEAFDEKEPGQAGQPLPQRTELTLEDFLEQMQSMKKMGGIREMLKLLPGMSGHADAAGAGGRQRPEKA